MLSRLLKKTPVKDTVPVFTKKPFFRSEQKAFYARLRRALPKCYIFPDVELRTLMTPVSTDSRQRRMEKEYLVGRKVDYAVFDARLTLVCVIELKTGGVMDSSPGSNAQLFKKASIRHFCWDKQKLPSSEQMLRMFGFGTPEAAGKDEAVVVANSVMSGPPSEVMVPRATSLNFKALESLAPQGHTKASYPHVWERICMSCTEPSHLEDYLFSLTIQTRASTRAGFPPEVLSELNNIEEANARFVPRVPAKPGWNEAVAR